MSRLAVVVALFSAISAAAFDMRSLETKNSANILLGYQSLSADWDPCTSAAAIGMNINYTLPGWPIGAEFGVMYSRASALVYRFVDTSTTSPIDNKYDMVCDFTEWHLGLYKYFQLGKSNFHLFLGGGGVYFQASVGMGYGNPFTGDPSDPVSAFDDALSGYVHGGIFYEIDSYRSVENYLVGIDVRMRFGAPTLTLGWDEVLEQAIPDHEKDGTAITVALITGLLF
ncbi:MAG: hypothetical protein ABIH86_03890 [Planctomycetota bacterium]